MFSIAFGLIMYKVIASGIFTAFIYFISDKAFNRKIDIKLTWALTFFLMIIF